MTKKYPTSWRITNSFNNYGSSINGKQIIDARLNMVVIEWTRDIAPFKIERRYTEHKLIFETSKTHNPSYDKEKD